MRRRRTAIALAAAAGAIVLVAGFGPGLLAPLAAARLSAALRTPVRLGWVAWNPATGVWTVSGIRIAAATGPAAFRARRVAARVHLWDWLRGDHRVRTIELAGTRLRLRATPTGWELPLPRTPSETSGTPRLVVDWIGAPRAAVRLEPRPGVRSVLRMRQLELSASLGRAVTEAALWTRGRLDRGSIAFAGRIRSAGGARRIRLRLAATSLDVARVLRLAPAEPVRDLRGLVDVQAKYDERGDAGGAARRVVGSTRARDLALGARGVDGVWLHDVALARFDVDLTRSTAALGRIVVHGADLWIGQAGIAPLPGREPASDATRWSVGASAVEIDGAALHDAGSPPLDVRIEHARAGPVTAPDVAVPFSFEATLDAGGSVSADGEVVRTPLTATVRARAHDVGLAPALQRLGAPVRLESGRASGTLAITHRGGAIEASGDVTLADVKTISPDPARPEDVLAFKEARIRLRRGVAAPPSADVDAVEIDWPYVLVDRSPDGIFPLSLVQRTGSPNAAPATIRIGHVGVLGGRLDFRDTTLSPPYWRSLASLRVDARNVRAPSLTIERIESAGLIDELSPLDVSGTVGTRSRLVAHVERLALPPFNAYLEGASPYVVSSGLLSGRSEVVLERSQLEVDNHVVLSRLGLGHGTGGDLVEREIGIPMTLALALMKDYRGDIALALPFGGDVTQPGFAFRSIVLQAIVRAIRNAILSPLNALGRVFLRDGRIEKIELQPIAFVVGDRALSEEGRSRLAQVAHVLAVHPELGLRLRGMVAEADVERLRDEAVLSMLVGETGAEEIRAHLRARLAAETPPTLGEADRARLDALRARVPWPGEALNALAVDRGAVAAAAIILEHKVDPARVAAVEPEAALPGRLDDAPAVAVELAER